MLKEKNNVHVKISDELNKELIDISNKTGISKSHITKEGIKIMLEKIKNLYGELKGI